MEKLIIKFLDKIIIALLGIAGVFTGCKSASDYSCEYSGSMVLMYGPPSYIIKGSVTNKANSKPIPNIQIISQISLYTDTFYTDADGKYVVLGGYYLQNQKNNVHLKLQDIDAEANGGHFATKEINVKITDNDREKMDKCYMEGGIFMKIQNIELKKK